MQTVVGKTLMPRVMIRLKYGFTLTPSSPVMTSCPAKVPTTDEAIPEKRRVIAKITAAAEPNRGPNISYAWLICWMFV